ncbi:hypothetical protein ACF0H5_012586 [Mactra antiquata]
MDSILQNMVNIRIFTIFTVLLLLSQAVSTLDVIAGNDVILICPLDGDYPEWTGPSNLASPLTNGTEVLEPGFEWSGTKDLKISFVNTMNTGDYKCSNGSDEGVVELNVLSYFVSVSIFDTVFTESGETLKVTNGEDLTVECWVVNGNPAPTVTFRWQEGAQGLPDVSNVTIDTTEKENSNTYLVNASVTFKADISVVDNHRLYCVASFDVDEANDTEASALIYVIYLMKEDNGITITCIYTFEGENTTAEDVYTIDVPFSPIEIVITGDPNANVGLSGEADVELLCRTNAGNPKPTLRWYKGTKDGELLNTTMFDVTETDDLYNGVKVSQHVLIKVDRSMDKTLITCCTAANELCDSVELSVSYPPEILAPQLSQYRVYVYNDISIPCIVDSNPDSILVWYKQNGTDTNMIKNNTDSTGNTFNLEIVRASKNDSGIYECEAWLESLGQHTAVNRTTSLEVLDLPSFPRVSVYMEDNAPRVQIVTNYWAPEIPRKFYLQFRKSSGIWLEIAKPYHDTQPGQANLIYNINFKDIDLQSNTNYEVRVKSVDEYGLTSFSTVQSFTSSSISEEEVDENTVSRTQYRNAILISVFVTAGIFLVIILIIVCLVKNGKCQSSSSKSYVM